jgi:hypothetical protein
MFVAVDREGRGSVVKWTLIYSWEGWSRAEFPAQGTENYPDSAQHRFPYKYLAFRHSGTLIRQCSSITHSHAYSSLNRAEKRHGSIVPVHAFPLRDVPHVGVLCKFSNRSALDRNKWCNQCRQQGTVHHLQYHTLLGHSPSASQEGCRVGPTLLPSGHECMKSMCSVLLKGYCPAAE